MGMYHCMSYMRSKGASADVMSVGIPGEGSGWVSEVSGQKQSVLMVVDTMAMGSDLRGYTGDGEGSLHC